MLEESTFHMASFGKFYKGLRERRQPEFRNAFVKLMSGPAALNIDKLLSEADYDDIAFRHLLLEDINELEPGIQGMHSVLLLN